MSKYQDCFGLIKQFEADGITLLIGDKEFENQAVIISLNEENFKSRIERYEYEGAFWVLKDTITTMLGYGMRLRNEDINGDGNIDFLVRYHMGISGNAMQIPFLRNGDDNALCYQSSFNQPNLVNLVSPNQFWSVSYNGGPCNGNSYSHFKCVGDSLQWMEGYRVRIVDCARGTGVIHHSQADSIPTVVYEGPAGDELNSVLDGLVPLSLLH